MNKKKIGEGGAAEVQIMKSKTAGPDAKVFAVKEFRSWDEEEETKEDYVRKIKSEYAISKSCDHPNIVATFHLCRSGQNWFHVMQYCDLGDLCDLIAKRYMSDEMKDCMFKQLVRGVDYLHSSGIAHRDLKSENVMVGAHRHARAGFLSALLALPRADKDDRLGNVTVNSGAGDVSLLPEIDLTPLQDDEAARSDHVIGPHD